MPSWFVKGLLAFHDDAMPGVFEIVWQSEKRLGRRKNFCLKQETIKEEIAKLREAEPHLSFALAWNRLMRERPESFDFEEG
jgi:hypothetical protein